MGESLKELIPIETADKPTTETGALNTVYGSLTRRRERNIEVAVFLFLIVQSSVLSLFAGTQMGANFTFVTLAVILRNIALISLILFFLWRNQEPVSRIGWTVQNFWKEMVLGVGLYIPFFIAVSYFQSFLQYLGIQPPPATTAALQMPTTLSGLGLAVSLVTAVAISEETIFRGYLMLRLSAMTKSITAAVLLSTFVFTLGHGYEGALGMLSVAFMGILLALVYWWRKSIVAPAVIHFIQDFISIIVVSLVSR